MKFVFNVFGWLQNFNIFSCIDENFFVAMRDARGWRTRQALKNIYTLLLV